MKSVWGFQKFNFQIKQIHLMTSALHVLTCLWVCALSILQDQQKNIASHLRMYSTLTRLRSEVSFHTGSMRFIVVNENIMSFLRHARNNIPYLVILNVGHQLSCDNYTLQIDGYSHLKGQISFDTSNMRDTNSCQLGYDVELKRICVGPGRGIVLKLKHLSPKMARSKLFWIMMSLTKKV